MEKIIRNAWRRVSSDPYAAARILSADRHPEGFDVDRVRFVERGVLSLDPKAGHLVSVITGNGKAARPEDGQAELRLEAGVHLYIPPGHPFAVEAEVGTELVSVSCPDASRARGTELLVRNERYLAACAVPSLPLRWILTPQYLSRRIFLHHDRTLLSRSGNPVSWFRTTMFDVEGLPGNEDGEPVFKMSYNSRTEFNVCYDVKGTARVRMALHPYSDSKQPWGPWHSLDGDATYHLNETAGGPEEESRIDEKTGKKRHLRNKHEVFIADGHVSLFCLFDPAPTGAERHKPGEYSDYEPLSEIVGTDWYEVQQNEMGRFDEMVDRLSLARALGGAGTLAGSKMWDICLRGREAQRSLESRLAAKAAAEAPGRERVIRPWMQTETDQ